MPAKSKAQWKFMQAAAHSPKFAKKAGIKPGVAAEFVKGQKKPPALSRKRKDT